ncbi:MAG TPA: hypothetical protein P5272_03665 [Caldisericia bacterium]|nr:hypothetical protein [Caldisericia bacterium]HON83118.1 hypothetical protein [Caldisericia bacterium]HPC57104.1 hypothetical protein [Caldisericia bacterium]HQJ57255.1 hypothetical protein [Caldisericia bacterium]HRT37516.1 hypothetical protein [Caldisericia bacterium]
MADLHIHSTLSPCGSLETLSKNVVKEVKEVDFNLNSITNLNYMDNTLLSKKIADKNCNQVQAKKQIFKNFFVMDLRTKNKVHLLIYFDDSLSVCKIIYEKLPDVKNDSEYFSIQAIVDVEKIVLGHEEKLLINLSKITHNKLYKIVKGRKTDIIPSFTDTIFFYTISLFGFIQEDVDTKFLVKIITLYK